MCRYSEVPKVFDHGPCRPTVLSQPETVYVLFSRYNWSRYTDHGQILLAPHCKPVSAGTASGNGFAGNSGSRSPH
jgi:hypothetical protein